MNKDIFKAYDIRGIYPTEINAKDVYDIARAYAFWLKPKKVALGRDVRLSGEELWNAAAKGLTEMGVDVVDLGVISTDMLYFTVAKYGYDGGITISASHNAGEYNGMKMVREQSKPISIDTGLAEIRDIALTGVSPKVASLGKVEKLNFLDSYVEKMISFVPKNSVKALKILANPNFGAAGEVISKISNFYNLQLSPLNFEADGSFPKGKPDPLQPANREETESLIKNGNFDFGVTWDADADRCFFYDEKGNFIQPYYITGLLIEYFLKKQPASVVIDPRLRWLQKELVSNLGGTLVINKSGHSFIKERMRREDALFGAEASAHYYFRDLWYTDNGMVPFVIMLELVSVSEKPLSEMISGYENDYYVIPETNFVVSSVKESIAKVRERYSDGNIDDIDGFSVEYTDWRFNIRGSNTEPFLRLNLEATSKELAESKLTELTELISEK